MEKKIVRLSVHKNTLEKRKQKELKTSAITSFKKSINEKEIEGFFYVVIREDELRGYCKIDKNSKYRSIDIPEITRKLLTSEY